MIMETFEKYQLKDNPFRMVPTSEPEKLIWAGFGGVKEAFENRIKRSIGVSNSSLVLNMGEYGSGKTHAAMYFSKPDVLKSLTPEGSKEPLSIRIDFPSSKNVVYDLYMQVIDKIDFNIIQEQLPAVEERRREINEITKNEFIKKTLDMVFCKPVNTDTLSFLYGDSTATQRKSLDISRTINFGVDTEQILGTIFTFLTSEIGPYSCIILWLDEFEDITTLNSVEVKNTNSFIRSLLDNTPDHLLMFINFTMSSLSSKEDLFMYLQEAVKSRVKQRIEFVLPTLKDLKDYLKDLLNNPIYREEPRDDYFPFDENVIENLFDTVKNVSLRRFNEALSLLLESACFDGKDKIDQAYFESIKSEVEGWKDE